MSHLLETAGCETAGVGSRRTERAGARAAVHAGGGPAPSALAAGGVARTRRGTLWKGYAPDGPRFDWVTFG